MTEIKPFCGIVYNFQRFAIPHEIICPPYDVITPKQLKAYQQLNAYNMVHLTLPQENNQQQDKYQEASFRFNNWLTDEVLLQDKEPAIYLFKQEYVVNKKRFTRIGLFAALSLQSSSSIYGHEHTRVEPKEDRLKLLTNTQANLEPIFVLFGDSNRNIQNIVKKYMDSHKPMLRFQDQDKIFNCLWRLNQQEVLKEIQAKMANKELFIADGHHRYEVSLKYQEMVKARLSQGYQGAQDFNYIMSYLCPLNSSGLVIKPIHRLVKGLSGVSLDCFKHIFHIQKVSRWKMFSAIKSKHTKRRILGVYYNKQFYIFTLKSARYLNKIDKEYRCLDICLLNNLILKEFLGLEPEDKQRVKFSSEADDLICESDGDKTSIAFFLRPVKISDIVSLARKGKKMPSKSTYFYPKVPSGLVMYKFRENVS